MHTNKSSLDYLLKLDLINKLTLKNTSYCPEVERIVIQFSTKQFTNYLRPERGTDTDFKNKIKSILLYNFVLGFNPRIENHIETGIVDNNAKKDPFPYYINKVVLRSRSDINKFVSSLFIDNNFKEKMRSLNEAGSIFVKKSANKKTISVKFPVHISLLNDVAEFCLLGLKQNAIKDLHFNVSFTIKNCEYLNDLSINNLFPFDDLDD